MLVAEVETGALVHLEDPNYALLSGATHTIKRLLDMVVVSADMTSRPTSRPVREPSTPPSALLHEGDWMPWPNHDSWEFEMDFWLNLAEHPALTETENGPQS